MKQKKKSVSAYFTVEAALVLPVVIATIVFVICFLVFWHNACLMEQDVMKYTVRLSWSETESEEELERELAQWGQDTVTERQYAWEMGALSFSEKHNRLELKRSGKLMMGEYLWKAEVKGKTSRIGKAGFLRNCRKLCKITEARA